MSAARKLTLATLAGIAMGAGWGCADGFFAPRAPAAARAQLAIAATLAPMGGSAEAFDRADGVRVRVGRPNASLLLDTTFAFRSEGTDTHVRVPVELDSATLTVRIDIELRAGAQPLFGGGSSALLKQGETTPVTIELTAIPTALVIAAVSTLTAIGDSAWAHGAVVFATGDTIRTLHPTWTSANPYVVTAGPDSLLIARGEGQTQIRATYGTLTQTATVTVTAVVASVYVTPRDPTTAVGPYPVQFSAAVRDRRGNSLGRTVTWTSRDTTIARIDATGRATPGTVGRTWIVASVGSVRDSTTLSVGGVIPPGPAAPTSLAVQPISSAQVQLTWNDNSTDETGFHIERCMGVECTSFVQAFDNVGTTTSTGLVTSYNAQLASSTSYSFRVRAYNGNGNSAYSNVAAAFTNPPETVAPGAPDSLKATASSSTVAYLQWKPTGNVATGYSIERCTGVNCLSFTEVGVIPGIAVGLQQINLTAATTYSYRIRAFNGAGYSPYSNIATVRTP